LKKTKDILRKSKVYWERYIERGGRVYWIWW